MPDPNNPTLLLLGAIGIVGPVIAVLFKMLIAEKDARISYLEAEANDWKLVAMGGVEKTGQALDVAKQRGIR